MPDDDANVGLPVIETLPLRCVHLRSSGMYIHDDAPGDEEIEDDGFKAYWCFQTLKSFGPDDSSVGGRACRDRSRSCYEPI
jgi:hypothetical protein